MSVFYDTGSLRDGEIKLHLLRTTEAESEKNWLPAYHFEIRLMDGTKVGFCDLRVGYNENTYMGGNVGYTVFPSFRGRRYAAKACRLMLALAKKHGMEKLYITCDPDNTASARTCEIAGGELLEIAQIPEDHDMYARGKRQIRVYRFDV